LLLLKPMFLTQSIMLDNYKEHIVSHTAILSSALDFPVIIDG
jgi:hypothetical protein